MTPIVSSECPSTPSRSAGIDVLRVVGVVAVVAGHVFEGPWVQRGIYAWHVPLFFFLSGYFWSSRRTLGEEARRRTRGLLRPYVFWLAAIGVPFAVLGLVGGQSAKDVVLPLVLGGAFLTRPFSAFWFVTALFTACLAFRLLETRPAREKVALVVASLVVCHLAARYVAHAPWAIGAALAALVFLYAGRLFRKFGARIPSVWAGWAALTGGAIGAASGAVLPLDMKQALYGTPVASVAIAILLCAGATRLAEAYGHLLRSRAARWMSRLAQSAVMVVLSHSAVLDLLGTGANNWWPGLPLALLVPWSVGILILWTPAAPWVLGVERSKDRRERKVA